jgi:transcription antitermination factor NusG
MSIVNAPKDSELQWFAVRFKEPRNPNRRTAVVGAEYETYRGRGGVLKKRKMRDTGRRVFVAELLLQRSGFDVFLPLRSEWRRISRYNKNKRRVFYPLLANWIFVGWPVSMDRWHDLMRLDVVTGVAGADGRPMLVSQAQIDRMRDRSASGEFRAPDRQAVMRTAQEYSIGDHVRIDYGPDTGPLDGLDAVVVDINGSSARAMVRFLGGPVPVEIDAGLLVPR